MKIREVSCDRFAGLRLKDPLSFQDGINVVYGKNETGKSTLVNLITQLLFQNTAFGKGGGKKEFERQFFPVGSKSVGDSADGRITLETEDGRCELRKVWGAGSMCSLDTEDITKRDPDGINDELKKILTYGKGVYSELLLSSQKNTDQALKNILDATQTTDAKREITDAVTRAFAETGSLSVDDLEQRISEKIDGLASNWDTNRNEPRKKTTPGRHQKNIGAVLKAYYEWLDAKETLKNIKELSDKADQTAEDCQILEEQAATAEEKYRGFDTDKVRLTRKQDIDNLITRAGDDLNKWSKDLDKWPKLKEKAEKAKALETELANRSVIDIYRKAADSKKEIDDLTAGIERKISPEDQEIRQVKAARRDIDKLENSLCTMNIQAIVKMSEGHTLEITSIRTGQPVDITAPIQEAVRMTIPGIMEMELAPADLDIEETKRKIRDQNEIISGILTKYQVENADALKELADRIKNTESSIEAKKESLSNLLGKTTFEDLQKTYETIGDCLPRTEQEISAEILTICGCSDVKSFRARTETTISTYAENYGTPENLKDKIQQTTEEIEKLTDELRELKDISDKYGVIDDPDAYLEQLKKNWETKNKELDNAKKAKLSAEKELGFYQDRQTKDPEDEVDRTERELQDKKDLLACWLHIQEKLQEQKNKIEEHPLEDLTKRFTEYLSIISAGRITSDQPDADKLNLTISTNQRPVGYDLLSEGTKDTISLAFRLAVVDHLFPNGGGVIVLDDPLTDMDEDRVKQSCELIGEFAKRHQVIFLTCREEYQNYLNGNLITL